MGLKRRQFTKEFKVEAVRRLERGIPIAEAARALEVDPNLLHRWRKEVCQGPGNAFPGNGKQLSICSNEGHPHFWCSWRKVRDGKNASPQ